MTDHASSDAEIRTVCAILESISKSYPAGSAEADAIRDAALAYIVVHQHEILKRKYESLRLALGGAVTDETKAALRRVGVEPDDLEDDAASHGGSGAK